MPEEPFKHRLRRLRADRKQKDFAALVPGLPLNTYLSWEQGNRVPNPWLQELLVKAFSEGAK